MHVLFWLTLFILFYIYAGYPLLIYALSLMINHTITRSDSEPTVSLLIAAYNEEKNIREKIINSLKLDYPIEKLEIMVVSDGSTDRTDEIVKEFEKDSVVLFRVEGRLGKTEARNRGVERARGEIIVFSDANTIYDRGALRALVRNFGDSGVGMVSGRPLFIDPSGSPIGFMTTIFKVYENFIKKCHSKIDTLSGVHGAINALRKELYEPLPAHIIEDFVLPLKLFKKGHRTIFEPDAQAKEVTYSTSSIEFRMRVRVIIGGMLGLWYMKELLNPFRFGWMSFQLFSHKILRWSLPLFMVALFVFNLFLLKERLYLFLWILQILFYVSSLIGLFLDHIKIKTRIFSLPLYFVLFNAASTVAFLRIIRGKTETTWETLR